MKVVAKEAIAACKDGKKWSLSRLTVTAEEARVTVMEETITIYHYWNRSTCAAWLPARHVGWLAGRLTYRLADRQTDYYWVSESECT